jgi:hypothetical protein
MIDNAVITDCFEDLIGFEQAASESGIPSLDEDMLITESGKKVPKLHPLLSLENLYNCSVYPSAQFNDYLKQRRKDAIMNLIAALYSKKNLSGISRELLTDVKMYDGTGNFQNIIVKLDRFVGYRITSHYKNVALSLRSLGLQLTEINGITKIYVYHSSQVDPVEEISVNHSKANSFEWLSFDRIVLPFIKGGYYFIGYYESDITGQAIKREQWFKRSPSCYSCEHADFELYNQWSNYITIEPFYVDAGSFELNENRPKWNEGVELFSDGTNWGMNLAISVICDPSNLFCQNREMFTDALGKQIAVEFLNDLAYSTRDNQQKQKISQLAFFALGNKDNGQAGMLTELEKSIKGLNFNTSDLDKVCLPCQNEGMKIKIKSVY